MKEKVARAAGQPPSRRPRKAHAVESLCDSSVRSLSYDFIPKRFHFHHQDSKTQRITEAFATFCLRRQARPDNIDMSEMNITIGNSGRDRYLAVLLLEAYVKDEAIPQDATSRDPRTQR